MVTLWPIPEEAREELEDGENVKLTHDGYPDDASVVIAFNDELDGDYVTCDWEIDEGWA